MKIVEVGAFEAKNKLSSLLDKVEQGQRVAITRRGKCVALLVDPSQFSQKVDEMKPDDLIERLAAIRKRTQNPGCSLKDLVNEGHRV